MALKEPESMEDCEYFSRRAADEKGNKCIVWVLKTEPEKMNIKYTCGNCRNQGEITGIFAMPYRFSCSKCSAEIKIGPLKGKKKGLKKR